MTNTENVPNILDFLIAGAVVLVLVALVLYISGMLILESRITGSSESLEEASRTEYRGVEVRGDYIEL